MASQAHSIPTTARQAVMAEAWCLFRQHGYPGLPFKSLGRHFFGSCLKAAWAKAKYLAHLASHGAAQIRRWLDAIAAERAAMANADTFTSTWAREEQLRTREADLRAALALTA